MRKPFQKYDVVRINNSIINTEQLCPRRVMLTSIFNVPFLHSWGHAAIPNNIIDNMRVGNYTVGANKWATSTQLL